MMGGEHTPPFPLDGGRVGDGGAATPRPRHATGAVPRARRLRREQTVAERLLWQRLRLKKMNFRRQAPIGRFVVDFVHFETRLVIEVDGYHHQRPERQEQDRLRTLWLESQGFRVIRFEESRVRNDLDAVMDAILVQAVPPPTPTLPPSRGKGADRDDVR